MSGKADVKPDALPDLDDLLQCPVCYEIPSGQIFQCNEGHHVCGRCKARLDVCPVCRALFFGTRNYAMEELIANVRKLRAFKLGGKVTTGSGSSDSSTPVREVVSDEQDNTTVDDEENLQLSNGSTLRAPQACRGLFRCLCCKNGNAERLPAARFLNHLRYFHSPELIEGQSENGEYIQAWQFATNPGRITTAVRVSDMGIFFLIIEITYNSLCAWLRMAASYFVAHEFSYTLTISGNDREAIFSDAVWSSRSCEGSLKKRGHSLVVEGLDARALIAPEFISTKLMIRRTQLDQLAQQPQPRAVLRVASRGTARTTTHDTRDPSNELEPFLQDLQNDVVRLTRAFASLGREAHALIRSEAEIRGRIETTQNRQDSAQVGGRRSTAAETDASNNQEEIIVVPTQQSRSARRRMRQRLRELFNESESGSDQSPQIHEQQNSTEASVPNGSNFNNQAMLLSALSVVQEIPDVPANNNQQTTSGPSNNTQPQNRRVNKKNRRHRR